MTSYLETTRRSYDTVAADYHRLVVEHFADDPYHRGRAGPVLRPDRDRRWAIRW